jgi:hypothetical protein
MKKEYVGGDKQVDLSSFGRELHRTPKPDSDSDSIGVEVGAAKTKFFGVGVEIGIVKKYFSELESE